MRLTAPARDKKKVAKSFSKAARKYDELAGMQKDVGKKLVSLAPLPSAQTVVDIGCGTGSIAELLIDKKYNEIFGLDISLGMLNVAQEKLIGSTHWLQGDMESIPFCRSMF